ncbi:MAG: hypothetical protein JOZ56_05050, partial [Actinobacteria bacterium]|nr:hypothetical protein [Actinomycetota bacterium]
GNVGSEELAVTPPLLRGRNIELIGFSATHLTPAEARGAYLALVERAVAGDLTVEVERYGLDDVARAWAHQLEGAHRKIVVVP